jgi:serine/threonine protein kinase
MFEPGALVLDGRFKVVTVLGRGSATEAYVAEQVSLGRKVALKVIRPDLGVADGLGTRFTDEVKKLAAVDHPAIVRVIDFGQADTLLYLVTEHVEGAPLSTELKGEPLLPERGLELLTQLGEALSAVHEKGIVHGDLRPESVMLVKTARGEQVRLTDFGIAKLVDAESAQERVTLLTRSIGPAEYFSPEQARGVATGPQSDVYSFGVLAFQVLSGQLPLPGPGTTEFLQQHQHAAPKELEKAAPHLADQFRLCELVMKCLVKDPAMRPSPTRELWKKLAALPRPTEPTLFLEAMQRPPELPAKPQPPELPAARPKAPPELMPSVQMLTLTPAPLPGQLPAAVPAPAPPPNRRPLLIGLGAAVLLAVAALFFLRGSAEHDARHLVEMRQPAQALEVIAHAQRQADSPELTALKAAALHLSGAHADELAALRKVTREAVDPLVLSGPAEDFGKSEDAALKTLLEGLPREGVRGILEKFAQEPVSSRQWGALRWLDVEHEAKGLKLVPLYSVCLESNSCAVRKVAAKRLQELDDDSAVEALMRLRETPREGAEKSCGQDEAGAAVQALRRTR